MSELEQCRSEIKVWEKSFAAEFDRLPTKADIKANSAIRKAYKRYQSLKSRALKTEESKINAIPESSLFNFVFSDDSDVESLEPTFNAELGPTPQANGKVLSLFDVIPSPPESSPLKSRLFDLAKSSTEFGQVPILRQIGDLPFKLSQFLSPSKKKGDALTFKTPTKAVKPLTFSSLTPSRSSASLSSRLQMAAQSSPKARKNSFEGSETPLYLGKVNSRFSMESLSPYKNALSQSPSLEASPTKALHQTPTKPAMKFQVSPSPLKTQRVLLLGGGKRISTLFNELQNLAKDESLEVQKLEIERELQIQEEDVLSLEEEEDERMKIRRRKAKTQKRTTRRYKMKPRAENDAEGFDGKDVHAEIAKLNDVTHQDSEEEEESNSDDENTLPAKAKRPPSTTLRPISNNYKRLKINDPRTKRFKQRMRRR
ncbi:hypothetical protein PUMCH_001228 [Australozyma saopauloensis]|uniref:DNA replication regulator SLD2 n=1 Tax=Australozyma saopauloensis TaxID=291208 RepID=A0AAX4H6Y5_9ASCO|nr:hypothetical protein PUMCH_001228 [[Candida] saopauloensis]